MLEKLRLLHSFEDFTQHSDRLLQQPVLQILGKLFYNNLLLLFALSLALQSRLQSFYLNVKILFHTN